MNRFLTLTSSTLIATGLAVPPVAAFAQTANAQATSPAVADAAKTPTTMTTTPAATQAPVATTAKKDTLTSTQPGQTQAATQTQAKPTSVTKSETKTPAHGKKAEMHSMNTSKSHSTVKTAPAQDQKG
jgi:hypothetical protein